MIFFYQFSIDIHSHLQYDVFSRYRSTCGLFYREDPMSYLPSAPKSQDSSFAMDPATEDLACVLRPIAQVFLWVTRSLAFGSSDKEDLSRGLTKHLGPVADITIAHHYAFLRLMAHGTSERLKMHKPGCPCLGADERWILDVMNAFERGDTSRGRQGLASRLGAELSDKLAGLATELAFLYASSSVSAVVCSSRFWMD